MPDNGNKTRPVRTLTVKNFSVIKDAKLEFGKITVLIGPQASGKSLLCKLAYFLGGEIPGIAVESLLDRNKWDEFLQTVNREFRKRFLTDETSWPIDNTSVSFTSHEYSIQLRGAGTLLTSEIDYSFSNGFKNLYSALAANPAKQFPNVNISRDELRQNLFVEIGLLLSRKRTQSSTYIPSGRSLFSDAATSIVALQNPDIDQITRRFAGLIAWDPRWKAGNLTTGRGIIQEVEEEMYQIAGGIVSMKNGKPYFLSDDGRNLPLSVQSSGTLELLPMFNVVDQLACFQEHVYARADAARISPIAEISEHNPLVYLEEPEAHIFPKAQYRLIRLFAWLANDPILDFDWIIPTHSPYILTAFNDLIKAGSIASERPGKAAEVEQIIPSQYWIKPGDFAAYAFDGKDGALHSIMDDETKMINGDTLDDISEKISEEFGQLLEIQYGD
ncbi:MAG: AAA family ATPase [Terracidiphilus sp.]|nr:AAA family ATPase [Terracidiphilus sp.]MDR3799215.1 AAA family ATPase [Terracidiphilus sp.]